MQTENGLVLENIALTLGAEKGAQLDEDSSHSSEKHSRTTVSSEDVALAREATNDINRDPSSVKPIDSPLSFVALLTKADGKLTHLDSSVKDQETEGSLRSIEDIENTADQKVSLKLLNYSSITFFF